MGQYKSSANGMQLEDYFRLHFKDLKFSKLCYISECLITTNASLPPPLYNSGVSCQEVLHQAPQQECAADTQTAAEGGA